MTRRTSFNAAFVIVMGLALLTAAILAYGTDPYWGQFRKGLGLIIFTQRLQWVLATVSLLCCLAVVTMIVAGRRRVYWLIALGPVLALFAHRILSNPMRIYSILDNPAAVKGDAVGSAVRDEDFVVGVSLNDESWAYPYAVLYGSPVILQASHEQRFMLIWSAFANRAVAYKVDHEIRYRELSIASMPADALLLYNARDGEFINGVTGLTTKGEKPSGFHTALVTHKMTWGQWKSLHPETLVLLPRSGKGEVTTPVLPRFEVPGEAGARSATRPSTELVIFAPTTRPVAVPEAAVTKGPNNISAGPTQLLMLRDNAGQLRAFDRHVDSDLTPFFHPKSDPKHPSIVMEDNDSGSQWSAEGKAIEGRFKGKQLATIAVDDAVYWGVIKYWFPDVQWTTPRQPSGPPPVFDNPKEPKKENADEEKVTDVADTTRPAARRGDTEVAPRGKVFGRLLRMLRPQYPMIALGLLLLILGSPCELFPAVVWQFVTDDIALKNHTNPLLMRWFSFGGHITNRFSVLLSSVMWLFIVYLIGEVFGTLESWLLNRVAQKFMLGFRNQVYQKLQSQSLGYLQRQRTGDLMSRALGDVDELQSFIVNGIDTIVAEGILWIATVAIVLWSDWRVATISMAPLFFVYVLLRIFNRKVQPIYKAARERLGDVSTRLQENLAGVVVIKIFNREKQEKERFEAATQAYYGSQLQAINARHLFFPISRVVGFLSNVLMIGVGGFFMIRDYGVKANAFTPGKLLMFRAYWWRLFGPIQTLARVNDMVQRATAAGRRAFEVLDAPEELPDDPDATPVARASGAMALTNVSFNYGTEIASDRVSPTVLHDVSIEIRPGQTVALCGPSGSGKSTVLNLLLRFYDPTVGAVTLDVRDLRSITRDSLRTHFALVQQETFLFNDSILDNIRYGHGEATMEQVVAAAKAANAHGFIGKLPNGYETRVGERGVRLSGGQKQRISIARAFLANPQILLLDEPTSSVEPDSEAAIIAALDRLMTGRTTVLTSHRPSLINQADVVYVIEDGRVTASGSPQTLRSQPGWFRRFMRTTEGIAEMDEAERS